MKHIIIFLLSLVVMVESVKGQQTITLNNGSIENGAYKVPPTRDVELVNNGYIVTYNFDKATIVDDPLYEGSVMWEVAGFGINDTGSEPAIPYRVDCFTVPNGYSATVEIVDSVFVDLPYSLSPARPPLTDSGNEGYTKDNVPAISPYKGYLPTTIANENGYSIYRGNSIVNILVSAVQYDYEHKTVRAYKKISYKVSFAQDALKARQNKERVINTNDPFLNNVTINGLQQDNSLPPNANPADENLANKTKGYLILSTPKFNSAVEKFAEWKKVLGFDVHTVLRNEWTPETVKQEVQKQYDANSSLYYLLIIGDHADVPAQTSTFEKKTYITDFYYSCMDDDADLIPDLQYGRLPVSTDEEANTVVNKIIAYEQFPTNDTLFYKTGLHCAYFEESTYKKSHEGRRFVLTSEEIRNSLINEDLTIKRIYKADSNVTPLYWNKGTYSFGDTIPTELRKPNFAWSRNASDINIVINQGAFYVLHRDHGKETYWGEPYYSIFHINNLSNGNKFPVVFSINCKTGNFSFSTDCFCEAFLKKRMEDVWLYSEQQNPAIQDIMMH